MYIFNQLLGEVDVVGLRLYFENYRCRCEEFLLFGGYRGYYIDRE